MTWTIYRHGEAPETGIICGTWTEASDTLDRLTDRKVGGSRWLSDALHRHGRVFVANRGSRRHGYMIERHA